MCLSDPGNTCSPPTASHSLSRRGGHCVYLPSPVAVGQECQTIPCSPAKRTSLRHCQCSWHLLGAADPVQFSKRPSPREHVRLSRMERLQIPVCPQWFPFRDDRPSQLAGEGWWLGIQLLTQSPQGPSQILSQALH